MDENSTVVFPDDFSSLSRDELQALQTRALAEFDALAEDENIDDAGVARLEALAQGMESITEALAAQKTAAENRKGRIEALRSKMAPPFPPKKSEDDDEEDEGSASPTFEGEVQDKDGQTVVAAGGARTQPRASLAVASQNAPVIPEIGNSDLTIVAATATPGVPVGDKFATNDQLVAAFQTIARSMAPTHGNPSFQTVASIQNQFDYVVGLDTNPNDVDVVLRNLLSRENQDALVAGGGWCAPSEIRYDFFNIACQDGTVDLPTIGIRRGGIKFPDSPSLADVYTGSFTNATNPWLWTEVDDEAAASGLGGAVTKPCVRVDCPDFEERRLECYGICLTAGNLTDNAYPEATRNHLSLLMSAHYHAMNARFLSTMELLSTNIVSGGYPAGATGTGILADAPAVVALAAQDYRTKYGMCDNDVLEVVFPRWVKDAMRIDHLRRTGFWENALTDAEINRLFTAFRIRPQWVNDWQIRGTGEFGGSSASLDWPSTVKFMIYAAGTFVKGNGMSLDLGVVRDSVLNSTNDFTAAWTEECHLIAKIGHESRLYTIPVCTAGRTGSADINCNEIE